jgi:hypothetical protein
MASPPRAGRLRRLGESPSHRATQALPAKQRALALQSVRRNSEELARTCNCGARMIDSAGSP